MKQLKQKTIEFLCGCEGYHQILKMLHWSASSHAQHVLIDEIDGDVLKYEDEIAEVVMGLLNTKFGVGDLKTLLPSGKTLPAVLAEMKKDVIDFKTIVGDEADVSGLQNVLDDFMSNINKWGYLETLS